MKRVFGNVIFASAITLGVYIALYMFWGLILSGITDHALINLVTSLITAISYDFFLVYTSKVRDSVGEKEVISDYKNCEYSSVFDDFKCVLKREAKVFLVIFCIVIMCFILNTIDSSLFEKKTISFPTFIFAPMCMFETVIDNSVFGYAVSAVLNCIFYIVFLLIYRIKKYRYWTMKKA